MKKLITICVAVGLMLSPTCVSWAVPTVSPPPGAPSWWNADQTTGYQYYTYAWWEENNPWSSFYSNTGVSPPNDDTHWASNFLKNTDFWACSSSNPAGYIDVYPANVYVPGLEEEIYIYTQGRHNDGLVVPTLASFDTDGGTFTGTEEGAVDGYDGTILRIIRQTVLLNGIMWRAA